MAWPEERNKAALWNSDEQNSAVLLSQCSSRSDFRNTKQNDTKFEENFFHPHLYNTIIYLHVLL